VEIATAESRADALTETHRKQTVRRAAVAGLFYAADPEQLRAAIGHLLANSRVTPKAGRVRALIALHAGYVYSGPVDDVPLDIPAFHHFNGDNLGTSKNFLFQAPCKSDSGHPGSERRRLWWDSLVSSI
jgi:hypothetical protein